MNNPDDISESLETIFWKKNTYTRWCGSGIRDGKNSDPGWKKFGSGINIPDPQHCKLTIFSPPIVAGKMIHLGTA
jgi:hypothetical protein